MLPVHVWLGAKDGVVTLTFCAVGGVVIIVDDALLATTSDAVEAALDPPTDELFGGVCVRKRGTSPPCPHCRKESAELFDGGNGQR